ncbi:MAG: glycosyl hydrolase family 18 protein [Pseudomonadota bacterium]
MNIKRHACVVLAICFLVSGCGGGGSSNSDSGVAAAYNYFPGRQVAFTQTSGKVVGGYLYNGAIAGGYDLSLLPADSLTHMLYAFLTICGPGQSTSDTTVCAGKTDFELAADGSTVDNTYNTAFLTLKQRAPNIKILASIGGGGGSNPFFYMAGDSAKRAVFINSVVSWLNSHTAFDGVDIDWEAPTDNYGQGGIQLGSVGDGQSYVDLLHDLRTALDQLGITNGRQYQLTSAVITYNPLVTAINYAAAQVYVDYFFAMTYDYFGSWSSTVGHHASLYPSTSQFGIQTLIDAGVPRSKLVQGAAMYSRGWGACTDDTNPMQGTGNSAYNGGDGTEVYSTLATGYLNSSGNGINGYQVRYDSTLHAYYLWNATTFTFIGYDDPRAVVEKGQYVVSQNLAGIFAWQLTGDNGDILSAMNHGVGNTQQ